MSNRDVTDVISQMLLVIPDVEVELIQELTAYKNSLWNIAPEALSDARYWIPVRNILINHIPDIDAVWKRKLQNIFMNTE
jgi:hypothetical protein